MFYEESAENLVKSANVFAASSTITVMDSFPLIDKYFKENMLSTDAWDFYVTIASVGTAFFTVADYVPKEKREIVCNKIGAELIKFHPKGYQALENLSSLIDNYYSAGIPFHNAVGSWLAINLLEKSEPNEEEIATFSVVGAFIQKSFGSWFKKNKKNA
ncbi:MAG TPA: hypothetical protein PKW92_09295 [Smithella sp.]|jgi:hypothetical protein|nr:hypothetical protein [Syntrophaceae bacterium]MBP8609140.1 hypothetical protein [Syntrophaceae bacterium]NMD04572.1 hypothetical protein [Deltaproteobacteria bacterium]HNQ66090.1 hypothetical protein [Smithella sp.]HPX31263.1 hypothetical protein [Smithella sp.]